MNAYYEVIAREYARHRRVHPEVLRCLISTGNLGSASSVLEVGCGTGNYLVALDEVIGCDCWGIDPSEAMLAEARKRSTKAQLFCVPAERMGLPADQFDLVFAVDVIHHIFDRSQAFRECRRVLRAGGALCLVTESPSMIRRREPHATYFPEAVPVELARYPSLLTLSAELHEAGFIDLTQVEVEFPCELVDLEPYRAKVHSSLDLITQDAFDPESSAWNKTFARGQFR
jgi:ubiquinone/menaquinone biosynthesis C-methylase UbiE